uniref:Uncharacterized protein n=1 Tax=Rhizophora mucronata TaxID=61149 RepID=A0A2P2QDI3_RHIMU
MMTFPHIWIYQIYSRHVSSYLKETVGENRKAAFIKG